MKVLVTGFAGYLGPVIVRTLRSAGIAVDGLDVGWFLPDHAEPMEYPREVYFADIREALILPYYDAVVHLAGLSNDPLGDLHPNLTDRINVRGTLAIMRGQPNARHVFVSSCSVYGANEMARESSPVVPLTAYARSKAEVDALLALARGGNGADTISLRLGTAYGYSPGHRLDLVVNKMVKDAVDGLPITVNGNASRPLTHVEDIATAVLWAVQGKERGIVNVVGENWRIADLAEEVASFTGADIIRKPPNGDLRDYMADGSLLRSRGWEAKHSIEGSIPVLAEKSITLPPGHYTRLESLKGLMERGVLTEALTRKEPIAA